MKTLSLTRLVAALVIAYAAFVNPATLRAGADVPRVAQITANRLSTTRFEPIVFRGGEVAAVGIEGDGGTILDLYVYDSAGNLVGKDEGGYVRCFVLFTPARSGRYYVEVVNRGRFSNTFNLATN